MTTTESRDDAGDGLNGWLQQAFTAERAPVPCRLPTPKVTERAAPMPRAPVPTVRSSFVLMLALSASALLAQLQL
jgi:hypothetical protein